VLTFVLAIAALAASAFALEEAVDEESLDIRSDILDLRAPDFFGLGGVSRPLSGVFVTFDDIGLGASDNELGIWSMSVFAGCKSVVILNY
jgi:hypothetical protein